MPIDSIAKLRYTPSKEHEYRVWLQERTFYREESSLYQRVRRQIPKNQTDCTYEQLIVLAEATKRYKEACKRYYEAQLRWNSVNSPLYASMEQNEIVQKIVEAVQGLKQPVDAEAEKLRFGAIATSPELSAIASAVAARNEAAKQAAPELELSDEIDEFTSD